MSQPSLEIRSNLTEDYADVYTPAALDALRAVASLDRDRHALCALACEGHATSNYAVLYTAKGVASIFGGWVGALLYEQSGSWTIGFYSSAVMALIAAGMAVKLRVSTAPSRVMVAAPAAAK